MRVWVTRSEPGATRLATHLGELGYECLRAPLIAIEATDETPPSGGFEHVIFLSEHAVSHALGRGLAAGERAQWYAIGPATAAALHQAQSASADADVDIVGRLMTPSETTSEGLLALPSLAAINGQRLLLVAGEDGRDTLLRELQQRGARVDRWCVYRRTLIESQMLAPQPEDACVASSAMVLEALTNKWLAAGGELSAPLCVPTQRVARVAQDLGWRQPVVSNGPTPAAVAAALAGLRVDSSGT